MNKINMDLPNEAVRSRMNLQSNKGKKKKRIRVPISFNKSRSFNASS
ncbi:hypothetical protein LSH36_582g02047, partial [Paralvinella palmiformis]